MRKLNIEKQFIPTDSKCFTGIQLPKEGPSSITIHWIGPYPDQTPEDVRHWWISSGGEASAHFIIKDERCVQCWSTDLVAWHAGCKQGNLTSMPIEVIPKNKEGEFSDESIETLKLLLRELPKVYIVRHYDWTKKDCPKFYVDEERWNSLLKKLK